MFVKNVLLSQEDFDKHELINFKAMENVSVKSLVALITQKAFRLDEELICVNKRLNYLSKNPIKNFFKIVEIKRRKGEIAKGLKNCKTELHLANNL